MPSFTAGGFDGVGGIGAIPGNVRGGAVSGRYFAIEQAYVNRKLRSVVGGVQHAAPKNPDALALDVEERHARVPPDGRLLGEESQARLREFEQTGGATFRSQHCRKDLRWRRLGRAEKFSEEAALR